MHCDTSFCVAVDSITRFFDTCSVTNDTCYTKLKLGLLIAIENPPTRNGMLNLLCALYAEVDVSRIIV